LGGNSKRRRYDGRRPNGKHALPERAAATSSSLLENRFSPNYSLAKRDFMHRKRKNLEIFRKIPGKTAKKGPSRREMTKKRRGK